MYNYVIIPDACYQISSYKIHFGHNNINLNITSQHKMHLIHVGTFCTGELESMITHKVCLDHELEIKIVIQI